MVPLSFRLKLRSQEAVEEGSVCLRCELSRPGVPVEWRRNATLLRDGRRHQIRAEGRLAELLVHRLVLEDAGEYSCTAQTSAQTSAHLTVRGKGLLLVGSVPPPSCWGSVGSGGGQYPLPGSTSPSELGSLVENVKSLIWILRLFIVFLNYC